MGRLSKKERQRISLYEFMEKFDTEEKCREHFEKLIWGDKRHCPRCGSDNTREASHKTMPYWCSACRKYFSVKMGTLMEDSNITYRKWLMAIYLMSTSLKGVASTKLGNDIGIKQPHAWFLGHRIRESWKNNAELLFGTEIEMDETYIGGKEHNKHGSKKLKAGRGAVGKAPVVGIKDRKTKKVKALKVSTTNANTLHWIVMKNIKPGSTIYTDQHRGYKGLDKKGYKHKSVSHSVGEFVNGIVYTNGIESFWSMLKRGYNGVYHKMSVKHLQKYIDEFSNRHNIRPMHTLDQVNATIAGLAGKRLKYKELINEGGVI